VRAGAFRAASLVLLMKMPFDECLKEVGCHRPWRLPHQKPTSIPTDANEQNLA
jgi:hypothetical protein